MKDEMVVIRGAREHRSCCRRNPVPRSPTPGFPPRGACHSRHKTCILFLPLAETSRSFSARSSSAFVPAARRSLGKPHRRTQRHRQKIPSPREKKASAQQREHRLPPLKQLPATQRATHPRSCPAGRICVRVSLRTVCQGNVSMPFSPRLARSRSLPWGAR